MLILQANHPKQNMHSQSANGLVNKIQLCKKQNSKSILPQFFRLQKAEDQLLLNDLIETTPNLEVHDRIGEQIKELFKIRNPKQNLGDSDLNILLTNWKELNDIDTYGVWVFYPWRNLLVHLVDKNDFIELRTSRNKYKITDQEQQDLSSKIVGVVGLSVGQSVSLTMAIERCFGTIRIADFDTLELTNLNRIRRGVDSLGLPKVTMVAREIYEIDPFLKVEVFPDGLNKDNIEDFFSGNGDLDLIVEECDSLDIKVLVRLMAKEKRIPLVMDTSDRGMLDIERYDLEPDRPIFHGLAPEEELMNLGGLSTEEKIPYVLKMVGSDTLSKRFKASMFEIKESITTWPQLASSVALGGAVAADVGRRILLKKLNASGRFFIDLDELITDPKEAEINVKAKPEEILDLDIENITIIVNDLQIAEGKERLHLKPNEISDLVEHAITAPSGGNCQAWKWFYKDGFLHLFHDEKKSKSFLDYENRGSLISFGAACQNVELRSKNLGLKTKIIYHYDSHSPLVASLYFQKQNEFTALDKRLSLTIKSRLSNRKAGEIKFLDTVEVEEFNQILKGFPSYGMEILSDKDKIDQLSSVFGRIERLRMLHKKSHQELFNEIRWTDEEAYRTRNGIDINTLELSASDIAGLSLLKDWDAIKNIRDWNLGNGFIKMTSSSVKKSSALCLLHCKNHGDFDVFEGGRLLQRIWLSANSKKIAFQPISPSTFMFYRILKNDPVEDKFVWNELNNINKDFNKIFKGLESDNHLFLFRLFYAEEPKIKSYRFDVEEVLLTH